MLHIGCHLSTSSGFLHMGEDALSINADTFAFFTRNPRGGRSKEADLQDVRALIDLMDNHHFAKLVAHAPYTMNLCSNKPETSSFAIESFAKDIQTMELLPGNYLNFHPGCHMNQGAETGISMIVEALNSLLFEGMQTTILLETMAGKGTEVGRSFEELAAIRAGIRQELQPYVGICLDTCHVFDSGYDIVNNLDGVLEEFDRIIGLEHLHAIHINDSKNPFASHKDRHEKIGKGSIGLAAFERIVTHPALRGLPFILETPQDDLSGWGKEIELLRSVEN
ncbi:MAG: deoxyribonuclease IV [Coriobacteriales bacterium]|nr:deoxyribonuclease IV [Coriobacteriales bacterium]